MDLSALRRGDQMCLVVLRIREGEAVSPALLGGRDLLPMVYLVAAEVAGVGTTARLVLGGGNESTESWQAGADKANGAFGISVVYNGRLASDCLWDRLLLPITNGRHATNLPENRNKLKENIRCQYRMDPEICQVGCLALFDHDHQTPNAERSGQSSGAQHANDA